MKKILILLLIIIAIVIAVFAAIQKNDETTPAEITLMTHDSFALSEGVLKAFEEKHQTKVTIIKSGDAGAALNQAILSKNNPLADVFYGVDNTFLSRALNEDVFESYQSKQLELIPDELKLDSENRLLPADYGDVCLNYDKQWFKDNNLAPPMDLDDLIDPAYKDLTVTENPSTSSPGLAFLMTTIGRYGESNYLDYWKKLKDNGVLIANNWEEAYWGHFTAASKGKRPIVVSYASSPPAEVLYSEVPLTEAPTEAITAPNTCFRQIEFVGILKGTKKQKLARALVDFILDKQFQEDIPLQMFVFPANSEAALPDLFTKHTRIADTPVMLPADKINTQRESWIEAWNTTILR